MGSEDVRGSPAAGSGVRLKSRFCLVILQAAIGHDGFTCFNDKLPLNISTRANPVNGLPWAGRAREESSCGRKKVHLPQK